MNSAIMHCRFVSWVNTLSLVFALSLLPSSADGDNDVMLIDGVAVIVADKIITFHDIDQKCAAAVEALRGKLRGDELSRQVKQCKLDAMKELIERLLIIGAFENSGQMIPNGFVEERMADIHAHTYHLSDRQFAQMLTDRGQTLDEFKKTIVDDEKVYLMTDEFVTQKVRQLKPANADEESRLTELIRKVWLDSLRQRTFIQEF